MLKQELEADGIDLNKGAHERLKDRRKTICKKFFASLILSKANRAKYSNKQSMKENFVMGTSTNPESPEAVLQILNAYQPSAGWNKCWQEAGATSKEGAMFVCVLVLRLWGG
jgi:hypothetical protein